MSKVPCLQWVLTPEAQISFRFALRSLVFQKIKVFDFPVGYNGEIKKIVKNRQLKFSKIQNSTFVSTTEKKIQEKVENILKVIWGRSNFLNLGLGSEYLVYTGYFCHLGG